MALKENEIDADLTSLFGGVLLCRVEYIAKLFDVTVRRVQQLTQEGIISTVSAVEDGRNVRRYELIPTIQRYMKYLSNKAYGKTLKAEKETELRNQKLQAEIALKESQGELHKMKTEIAAGKYIALEEVQMDYGRFFIVFKRFAMAIPSRVAGRMAAYVNDPMAVRRLEKEISDEVTDMLRSFTVAGSAPSEKDLKKGRRTKKDDSS